jgi:hypothetical protein
MSRKSAANADDSNRSHNQDLVFVSFIDPNQYMPDYVIDPSIDRPARRLPSAALTGILGTSSYTVDSLDGRVNMLDQQANRIFEKLRNRPRATSFRPNRRS